MCDAALSQGPIDVDSQLAELQRKYRILEARRVGAVSSLHGLLSVEPSPGCAGQPQGLCGGLADYHSPPKGGN